MKKILILLLLIAAFYPHAVNYYRQYISSKDTTPIAVNINDFVQELNKGLPRKQGFLTYDSAVASTKSVVFLVVDGMNVDRPLVKDEVRERLNTWRPFLTDYTCRNRMLSRALKNGTTNNVYFQFTAKGEDVEYGKIIVTPEQC